MTFLRFLALIASVLLIAGTALAFTPPPMTGHVTDTAGKLSDKERFALDRKLEDYRVRTTNEVAVFIPASLDGEAIEDVGIATGRAWKLGVQGKDNGVLLIIAPVERKARIEVGKGAEGSLTDLQANDIIRQKLRPLLAPGREDYSAAADAGATAIMAALGDSPTIPATHPPPASGGAAAVGLIFFLLVFLVPIILFIVIIRAFTRAFTSHGPYANRGWSSGSTWSNDSSYSPGPTYDSGWGSSGGSSGGGSDWGGGGGSGFSGGGGDFGGGGSSDSF